jgi:regulator of PEP synthase PpsR (kinase-PPPase family)
MGQIPEILATVAYAPGYVLHSISHANLRQALELGCSRLDVPCQFALEPMIGRLAAYTGASVQSRAAASSAVDEDCYRARRGHEVHPGPRRRRGQ